MTSQSQFINALEQERTQFEDEKYSLVEQDVKKFTSYVDLIKEKDSLGGDRSKQRRQRARSTALWILSDIGPDVLVLCSLAVSITSLSKIELKTAAMGLQRWWESAIHPAGLTNTAKHLCDTYAVATAPQKHALSKTQSELTAVPEISSNDLNITITQQQRVFGYASLRGISEVFNEYMCNAISRVTVGTDVKAAVTMVFPPWGGPVDCVMSLDVCERDVGQLAMALFNAKVKWVEEGLHVVLKEGTTLIVPNSEATLKGAPDAAIFKVFGPEIHDAMTQCPVRRGELAEGKHVTECVSMIFIKNGAIINLSLDLEGGFQIQNKLYA